MVMGNVSGRRRDGEGAEDGCEQRFMEFAQSQSRVHHDPLPPASVISPREFRPDLFRAPMRFCANIEHSEKRRPVMITWSHGGEKVAISGSWDDWQIIEPMWRSGKDFILVKVLESGIYHFRFIVDGHFRYAPDLPCDFNDPGGAYNIIDVKEYARETRESISDFELPPSPVSSYYCNSLTDGDFSRPPPDLPPQLHRTLLNEPGFADQALPRPRLPVMNHLYVKKWDPGEAIALGSSHRFLDKYVTVVLYKPSWRHR